MCPQLDILEPQFSKMLPWEESEPILRGLVSI